MAKLIYTNEARKPMNMNGTLYILIDEAMRKIMGLEKEDNMNVEVYWSEKHQDYYIAAYKIQTHTPPEDATPAEALS